MRIKITRHPVGEWKNIKKKIDRRRGMSDI
jgi:hypothetical protein